LSTAGRLAFVLDAARTPYGQRGGTLAAWHPVDLAAELLERLLLRSGAGASSVGSVFLGCASQVGAQAGNIARRATLAAGWPESVPGVTIESHVASSAQAVHWAAGAVVSGAQELVVAGGVEVMSRVPLGASLAQPAVGKPVGKRLAERYGGSEGLPPPGLAAENVARQWSLTRSDLDSWALGSYRKALSSQTRSPSYLAVLGGVERDESLEDPPSRSSVRSLVPAYVPGGSVTAANMAKEGDGASAVLVGSASAARRLRLAPKARFVAFATAGLEPALWPVATVPATRLVLEKAGLKADAIDWWYVHESSSAAVLAWAREVGVPEDKVNPEGGALASTSPAGAAGGGLFAMAAHCLAEGRGRRALVSVAAEGGVATACVLERVL
jgi:acetyl-CoA acyltransferase